LPNPHPAFYKCSVKSPRRKPAAEPDRIRNRPDRESRAQNQDAPAQRLLFLVLFRMLLGMALAHTALGGPDRDHIIGLIRALIERLEQQRRPAPTTDAAIRARRNQGPTGRRKRRLRAGPAAPLPPRPPHCASTNQVRGPPPHQHQRRVTS
jgi:hypothetical protein